MTVRYGNFSELVRFGLESDVEQIFNDNRQHKEFEKALIKYFKNMENISIRFYRQVLGLMLSDAYKLLNVKRLDKFIDSNELRILKYYEEFNNRTAVSYLELNKCELVDCFYDMNEFNSYDYFMKRSILKDSKKQIKYLCELSVFSIYDFLYYCQNYDLDIFKAIYLSDMNEGYPKDMVIDKIVSTINELYVFDKDNFKDVMIDLLSRFYLLYQNNLLKDNTCNDLMLCMNSSNIIDVLNYLNDDRNLSDVVQSYINFDGDIKALKVDDDDKILKKIKEIREI